MAASTMTEQSTEDEDDGRTDIKRMDSRTQYAVTPPATGPATGPVTTSRKPTE